MSVVTRGFYCRSRTSCRGASMETATGHTQAIRLGPLDAPNKCRKPKTESILYSKQAHTPIVIKALFLVGVSSQNDLPPDLDRAHLGSVATLEPLTDSFLTPPWSQFPHMDATPADRIFWNDKKCIEIEIGGVSSHQ